MDSTPDFTNTVTLTYFFNDGSSKQDSTTVTTAAFTDACGYENPTILQARTESTTLSYDYIMIKGACSDFSPAIIDTDGALRWVGTAGVARYTATFFDNAVYSRRHRSYRIDLDGTVTLPAPAMPIWVLLISSQYRSRQDRLDSGRGYRRMQLESTNLEVDDAGKHPEGPGTWPRLSATR